MSLGPNRSVRALRRSISSQTPSLGQIVGYPSGRPRLEFWNTSNGDYGTIATCITAASRAISTPMNALKKQIHPP